MRELLARVKAHLRVGRELNQARAEARSRSEMMDIMQEVTASLKPEEIYQILVRRVAQGLEHLPLLDHHRRVRSDETGTVVAAFENPMLHNLQVDLSAIPRSGARWPPAKLVLVRDVQTDPLYAEVRAEWEPRGRPVQTRSAIALRFSLQEQPAGVFFLRTTAEDAPLNEHDVQFAEQVIIAAVAALEKAYDLENAVLGQEQMRHLAETDPLTNCFNRRALDGEAGAGDGPGRPLRHDAHRHDDRHRQLQADQRHLRPPGGRPGAEAAGQPAQAGAALGRHRGPLRRRGVRGAPAGDDQCRVAQLRRAHPAAGGDPRLRRDRAGRCGSPSASGIASYPDERVSDGESLLRLADTHLYRAKSDGRNRFRD